MVRLCGALALVLGAVRSTTIGFLGDTASLYAVDVQRFAAHTLALREANGSAANGTAVFGVAYACGAADAACALAGAAALAGASGARAVVAPLEAAAAAVAAHAAGAARVPLLDPLPAGAGAIAARPVALFRAGPPEAPQIGALAELAATYGWTTVAALAPRTDDGVARVNALDTALAANGATIRAVADFAVDGGGAPDAAGLALALTVVELSGCRVLVVLADEASTPPVVAALRTARLPAVRAILAPAFSIPRGWRKDGGGDYEGWLAADPAYDPHKRAPGPEKRGLHRERQASIRFNESIHTSRT